MSGDEGKLISLTNIKAIRAAVKLFGVNQRKNDDFLHNPHFGHENFALCDPDVVVETATSSLKYSIVLFTCHSREAICQANSSEFTLQRVFRFRVQASACVRGRQAEACTLNSYCLLAFVIHIDSLVNLFARLDHAKFTGSKLDRKIVVVTQCSYPAAED